MLSIVHDVTPSRSDTRSLFASDRGNRCWTRELSPDQIIQVARPRNTARVVTSVMVVRTILDAFAGSAPSRLRNSGIEAPNIPLTRQLPTIERKTTTLSFRATGLF